MGENSSPPAQARTDAASILLNVLGDALPLRSVRQCQILLLFVGVKDFEWKGLAADE